MARTADTFEQNKVDNLLTVIGRCSQVCRRFSVYERAHAYEADGYARDVALSKAMQDFGMGSFVRLAKQEIL